MDSVWTPKLNLVTPASSVMSIDASVSTVRYFADGTSFWIPDGLMKVPCSIDIKYYPFDSQTCTILFADSNYFSSEPKLHAFHKEAAQSIYTKNGVWDITKTEAAIREQIVSMYTLTITLARKPQFVVMIVITPIMVLSLVNIMVFLLPPDSGERISLSMAQVVFLTIISENIPKTSSPVAILCYFNGMHVLLSTVMSAVCILNLWFYHRVGKTNLPPWVDQIFRIGEDDQHFQTDDDTKVENSHDDTEYKNLT